MMNEENKMTDTDFNPSEYMVILRGPDGQARNVPITDLSRHDLIIELAKALHTLDDIQNSIDSASFKLNEWRFS